MLRGFVTAVLVLASVQLTVQATAASCDKPELSREEVTDIALREGKLQGVRIEGPIDITIAEHGCEYDVVVSRKPAGPGEFFFVTVGRNKQVIAFHRGL
jgi:hypothetical protein